MGPEAQGRGYRLLASSGVLPKGSWQTDLPMSLYAWALNWDEQLDERNFLLSMDIGNGNRILGRGAYAGEARLGPMAWFHGIIIDPALLNRVGGRPELLVDLIPPAEGEGDFAAAERHIDADIMLPPPIAALQEAGECLAWRDLYLTVDRDHSAENVLVGLLCSVMPEEQRKRVRGFATTGRLEARGEFAPAAELNVIASHHPPQAGWPGHLALKLGSRIAAKDKAPPRSYAAWQAMAAMLHSLDRTNAGAISAWHFEDIDKTPDAIWNAMVARASQTLRSDQMVALFHAMYGFAAEGLPPMAPLALQIAAGYLEQAKVAGVAGQTASALLSHPDKAIEQAFVPVAASYLDSGDESHQTKLLDICTAAIAQGSPLPALGGELVAAITWGLQQRRYSGSHNAAMALIPHLDDDMLPMMSRHVDADMIAAFASHSRQTLNKASRILLSANNPIHNRSRAYISAKLAAFRQLERAHHG